MNNLQEILAQLIGFDTVSHKPNVDCAKYVSEVLTELGVTNWLDIEVLDGVEKANVVAVVGPYAEGGMFLSGHLDVVPFEGQPGWGSDPLVLTERNGRFFGRGVADMKGFNAAVLDALGRLDFGAFQRPLVLAFTCDEEIGCAGSGRLVERLPGLLDGCPLPEFGWIGEPTDFKCLAGHKGYMILDVLIETPGGHSSKPELGVNAIGLMTRIAGHLRNLEDSMNGISDGSVLSDTSSATTINLAEISGGLAHNMIPEECRMRISVRSRPDADQSGLLDQIGAIVAGAAEGAPENGVATSLEIVQLTPPLAAPLDSRLLEVMKEHSGEPLGYAPFATDGGHFAALGIKSYIFGPGELDQAHQPDESVSVDALSRCSTMIEDVCTQFLMG